MDTPEEALGPPLVGVREMVVVVDLLRMMVKVADPPARPGEFVFGNGSW